MSENMELAQRAVDAVNGRDLDRFLALMAKDVRFQPQLAKGGYEGHPGMLRWWKNVVGGIPDLTADVVEVRDLGDGLILTAVRTSGQGTASVVPFEQTFWVAARWQHRKCTWFGAFLSERDALAAAGPSE